MNNLINEFMEQVKARNPGEPEFLQALRDVVASIMPVIEATPAYKSAKILERLVEAERIIIFRVPWVDDQGEVQVNRGFRVEMNSALGPYKGGLRFHASVNLSILKFLAFEQIFKNSLTTLPMGGGKGGSDFDPHGKSDGEVMRFCQSFMSELFRHIGPDIDVPAGDIGVGAREIGYLFGQYKKLTRDFSGVITGKGLGWGGSLVRKEATGYGLVYFTAEMLAERNEQLEGKTVLVSGSGNVAQYAIEKLLQNGAKVVSFSDSAGTIHDPDGLDEEKLAWLMELKNLRRGRVAGYAEQFKSAQYLEGKTPWHIPCQLAFPCATQNEITADDARTLIKQNCICVAEGANMPVSAEGMECFLRAGVMFGPGKAANAGGVAVSGLEMSQNAMHLSWPREEVDRRLQEIMHAIHASCVQYGRTESGFVDYIKGANIAGFRKVANAMLDQGVV